MKRRSDRAHCTQSIHVFAFSGAWLISELKYSYDYMISGEQPIFTVFPDSLMGFCGLSLMAFGWTRGCPALPDSWCWCGETHRHQNSCLETAGGLQGVRFRFMMNSRLMTVLSITSADLQTVEGGREGRFVLLFKIELLFYYFFLQLWFWLISGGKRKNNTIQQTQRRQKKKL